MPPREQSITTSSKSATSKQLHIDSSVQYLKGVGPKIALLLDQKGIKTVRDALFYLPRTYQDRSKLKTIAELLKSPSPMETQNSVMIRGHIISHHFIPVRKLKRPILEARVSDGTGEISIKWFHYNRQYFESKFKEKPNLIAYGQLNRYGSRPSLVHPDIEWDPEESANSERILPVYSESEGLNQRLIRKIIQQSLEIGLRGLIDDLPLEVMKNYQLKRLKDAVAVLHAPSKDAVIEKLEAFDTPEHKRLIFEELFKFEWVVGRRRLNLRRETTKAFQNNDALFSAFKKRVPFELTGDQQAAIEKIFEDLSVEKPMNRLLQGDVGCGKTLVAMAAALPVIASGAQTALMVPTEILGMQHFFNAQKYLEGLVLPNGQMLHVEILTGSTPKAKREELLENLRSGSIHLLIGTHALLEDPVRFSELGLVIIDEQHRFGVDQRMILRAKGQVSGISPHILSLTATPIPRTLALTAYGDLDVSIIKELPKGRPEVKTRVVKNSDKPAMFDAIRSELKKGRQAYIIYPLVEESEKIDLANAVSGAEELANGPLTGFRVALLHGRMKPQEKNEVMDRYKKGEVQVLVSTTVVEVGVDVPNATVLVIENAERFGLSQLHQLRGRIGRGTEASLCFLVSSSHTEQALERLQAMEKTRDGFKLAELDLEIRGPGEFLGTRQSGELQFRFANLVRDQLLLQEARKAAFEILKNDPELEEENHKPLREYMIRSGNLSQKRFETA